MKHFLTLFLLPFSP